ncbi:MAG: hypothetical protein HAW62_00765 [Endozoicomonadaceae bacterium]|nr:hypothetical protein [Endozoicomonadaceae bacterium]
MTSHIVSEAGQGTTIWTIDHIFSSNSSALALIPCLIETAICSNTPEEKSIFEFALTRFEEISKQVQGRTYQRLVMDSLALALKITMTKNSLDVTCDLKCFHKMLSISSHPDLKNNFMELFKTYLNHETTTYSKNTPSFKKELVNIFICLGDTVYGQPFIDDVKSFIEDNYNNHDISNFLIRNPILQSRLNLAGFVKALEASLSPPNGLENIAAVDHIRTKTDKNLRQSKDLVIPEDFDSIRNTHPLTHFIFIQIKDSEDRKSKYLLNNADTIKAYQSIEKQVTRDKNLTQINPDNAIDILLWAIENNHLELYSAILNQKTDDLLLNTDNKIKILFTLTTTLVFGLNNSPDDGYPSRFSDYIQNFVAIAPDAPSIAEEHKIPVIASYLLAPQDRSYGRILNGGTKVLSTMSILIHLGFKMNVEFHSSSPSKIAEIIGLDLTTLNLLPVDLDKIPCKRGNTEKTTNLSLLPPVSSQQNNDIAPTQPKKSREKVNLELLKTKETMSQYVCGFD